MRYYLHQIQTNDIVRDPEGGDYPDLAAAEAEAVEAARELMASAIRAGRDISDWTIEIADETGMVWKRVAFASTVRREQEMQTRRAMG
ncbi:hypothetical protein [Aureimonas sp. AU4]|uniref:DUF6894 family protein n=1 Tax=Aureimonas sp. AU4 TaxID=1638163 RepID=UPI000784B182|nr:hypothetical protein [Aureimonas sp. AU4]